MVVWLSCAGLFGFVVIVTGILARKRFHDWIRRIEVEDAQCSFDRHRKELESHFRAQFLKRQLGPVSEVMLNGWFDEVKYWATEFHGRPIFLRDRLSGHITALVGVTIRSHVPWHVLEKVGEDEYIRRDFEDEDRLATAQFFHSIGNWGTSGQVFFNLEPWEIAHQLLAEYDVLPVLKPDDVDAAPDMTTPSKARTPSA